MVGAEPPAADAPPSYDVSIRSHLVSRMAGRWTVDGADWPGIAGDIAEALLGEAPPGHAGVGRLHFGVEADSGPDTGADRRVRR